jgi:hypothetical protein
VSDTGGPAPTDLRSSIVALLCTDHGHAGFANGMDCRTCSRRADLVLAVLTDRLTGPVSAVEESRVVANSTQTPAVTDEMIQAGADALVAYKRAQTYPVEAPAFPALRWRLAETVLRAALADRTVVEQPEPDWSALNDACNDYTIAYMHEDDSLMPAALNWIRRSLRGEDPYNPGRAAEPSGDGGDQHD